MAILLSVGAIHLPAQSPGDKISPPKLLNANPWRDIKEVPPDASIGKINTITVQVGTLVAIPVLGGKHIQLGDIQNLDYVPCAWWDDTGIAIYKMQGNWALVHSTRSGWYWVFMDPKEIHRTNPDSDFELGRVISEGLPSLRNTLDNNTLDIFSTDSNGFRIYSQIRAMEILPDEQLRVNPNMRSKSIGLAIGEYWNILGFKGDWVHIQEPLELDMISGGDDHNDILKVKWNTARSGWVRWRVKGPVPGSYRVLLRGITYFGVID